MSSHHYLYAGLRISSELPISEWNGFKRPQPFENAEVTISLQDSSKQKSHLEQKLPFISENDYRFHIHSVAYYQVQNGRTISVAPVHGANPQAVSFFLISSAMGAIFYQRSLSAMQASVFQVGKGAVAFCGTAEAGKPTFEAYLTRHGYNMVCNDLCRFDITKDNQVLIWPSISDQQPLKLWAIYLLEWGEWNLNHLQGQKALTGFIDSATCLPKLIEPMGLLAFHLQFCAKVVSTVPVWGLKRSKNLMTMDKNIELLKEHWLENKILESVEV